MIPVIDSAIFTIPVKIRDELRIDPGHTEIAYDILDGTNLGQLNCVITLNPAKPLFEKKQLLIRFHRRDRFGYRPKFYSVLGFSTRRKWTLNFWVIGCT